MKTETTANYTVTFPPTLVIELDQAIKDHYASRSSAIQEAVRDLLVKLRRRSLKAK